MRSNNENKTSEGIEIIFKDIVQRKTFYIRTCFEYRSGNIEQQTLKIALYFVNKTFLRVYFYGKLIRFGKYSTCK